MVLLALPILLLWGYFTGDEGIRKRCLITFAVSMVALTAFETWTLITQTDASLSDFLRLLAMNGQEGTLFLWLLALLVITWLYPWGRVTKVLIREQFWLMAGLLLSPRMSWHSPLVIISYALLAVPYAEALTGESKIGGAYLRWGWWCLSLSVALNAALAYHVLGRRSFWTWDVVEAAVLVPWLFSTIAFHLYPSNRAQPFSIAAYLGAIWSVVIRNSGILAGSSLLYFLYIFLLIHTWVAVRAFYGLRQNYAAIPLVWQALALYALWVAAGTLWPTITKMLLGVAHYPNHGYFRSGAVPAVALVLWSLRSSLKRDGRAQSLAHFGVVVFLLGAVASTIYTNTQTVALENGVISGQSNLALIWFGVAFTLVGGLISFIEDKSNKPK